MTNTTAAYRPNNRPAATVWYWFEIEFTKCNFPNVSWALGSDWGMGSKVLTAKEYKEKAYNRMTEIYGAKP